MPVSSLRVEATPLAVDSGVITLLRWSDKPLEVFLKDDESQVARLPPADRAWLQAINAALLVPIFAGGSDPRPFVGLIALGPKRSEEPYTLEDRELLRGIAVQMGVALDLSRLGGRSTRWTPSPQEATRRRNSRQPWFAVAAAEPELPWVRWSTTSTASMR